MIHDAEYSFATVKNDESRDSRVSMMKVSIPAKNAAVFFLLLFSTVVIAEEDTGENASDPLAKVRNTDIRWQYFDNTGDSHINDVFIDGAFMANDQLKIKYEVHYWETDLSGSSEQNLESTTLKAIYFPKDIAGEGGRNYRVAAGLDWIVDHGEEDKGIGSGSDQLAPFLGLAIAYESGLSLIPLVQHFTSYSGNDVSTTAFRIIMIKPLPEKSWLKLDAKVPIDWENDNAIPATAEMQLGRTFSKGFGAYADFLAGLGSDRPYDWGLGVGLRFSY